MLQCFHIVVWTTGRASKKPGAIPEGYSLGPGVNWR